MNPVTSLYLDAVRFTAAMTVFLGHVGAARDPLFVPPEVSRWLSGFSLCMDEAVVIFFVLSGFVIAHATEGRRVSATDYAVARLARIYSVALPALLATFLLDGIGRAIRPEIYQPLALLPYLGAFLFVNQLWYLDTGVGSNAPYWSLNYEVWYYLLFALLTFAAGWRRLVGVLAVLLFCGPQISLYFLLWLAGVGLYRLVNTARLPRGLAWLLCLGGPVIFAAAALHGVPGEAQVLAFFAWIILDSNILHDSVIALGFGMHLLGFHALVAGRGADFGWPGRAVRWLAGATFTIYLFHLPVSRLLVALLPWPPTAWSAPVILGGGFLVLLAISEVTERRKQVWQRLFRALLPRAMVRA